MAEAMSDERLAQLRSGNEPLGDHLSGLTADEVGELLAEVDRTRKAAGEWEPGRWYQVRRPDGTLWMETSDHEEAEAEARKQGWPLFHLWIRRDSEWREVHTP